MKIIGVRLAILALCCLFPEIGQGAKDPALPPDDPELDYSLLIFMDNFGRWLDQRGQQLSPQKKAELMASAGRYLKVDPNEIPKIVATCRSSLAKVKQVEDEARQYLLAEAKQGRPPDAAALRAHSSKRAGAIAASSNDLRVAVSSTSWDGLRRHVNGELRRNVRRPQ